MEWVESKEALTHVDETLSNADDKELSFGGIACEITGKKSQILSQFFGSDSAPKNGLGKWSHLWPIRLQFGAGFCSRMGGFEPPRG